MPKKINHDDLLSFHECFTDQARGIMRKKNKDYTGAHGKHPFANFTRSEALGICTTEQGFLVRMSDKLSRLATYCSQGKLEVSDESVIDTLQDLTNYCVLLAAYLTERDGYPFPWEEQVSSTMTTTSLGISKKPAMKPSPPKPQSCATPTVTEEMLRAQGAKLEGQQAMDNPGCCGEPEVSK